MKETIDYKLQQVTGADMHVKSLNDRIAQTPVTDAVWSGGRGVSKCYPTDKARITLLKKYGQTYVSYDRTAEVDFRPFEETHVQISDMTVVREKNFRSANARLLKTEWAKDRELTTVKECKDYFRQHNLTWHECGDGVTMRVVDTRINGSFGHSGGVGEIGAIDGVVNFEDGVLRGTGKNIGESKIRIRQKSVQIQQTIADVNMKENYVINAGIDAVKNAELEILFMGVQNLMAVICEEKKGEEVITDTVGVVGGIAATGMIDELVFGGAGVAPQIVAVAFVMKDAFMKYLDSEIDEQEFVQETVKKGASLFAGKLARVATHGNIVAQMLVTHTCSLIYNAVQKIIGEYKSINSMREEYRARLERVSRDMIEELQTQKKYLIGAFKKDSIMWNDTIEKGFSLISMGSKQENMQTVSEGINRIMKLFDSEVKFKEVNEVRNFINMPNRVLKL